MSDDRRTATESPGRRRSSTRASTTGATDSGAPLPPVTNGRTARAPSTRTSTRTATAAGGKHEAADQDKSTRDRILDVAMDLFIDQGYDKASLREIAERMGFTKAALYYHFPSKRDMLMAVHLKMHGLIEEPLGILGDGPVTTGQWETFLDACIEQMQANIKLFLVHRVNQAAFSKLHMEGHEGAHLELEEKARKIFSEPSIGPDVRLRMAAAFAVAFVTPIMAGTWLDLGAETANVSATLREAVRSVLGTA